MDLRQLFMYTIGTWIGIAAFAFLRWELTIDEPGPPVVSVSLVEGREVEVRVFGKWAPSGTQGSAAEKEWVEQVWTAVARTLRQFGLTEEHDAGVAPPGRS